MAIKFWWGEAGNGCLVKPYSNGWHRHGDCADLPLAASASWWDKPRCRSETSWRLVWCTCRERQPAETNTGQESEENTSFSLARADVGMRRSDSRSFSKPRVSKNKMWGVMWIKHASALLLTGIRPVWCWKLSQGCWTLDTHKVAALRFSVTLKTYSSDIGNLSYILQ